MNSLIELLNLQAWKPVLTALILPPVPFLLLILVGARLMLPRRGLGWLIILVSVGLLWATSCTATGQWLTQFVLRPPPALSESRIADLKAEVRARKPVAIVVLGAGMFPYAPEYGISSLTSNSLERLRYGLWLSRQTGAPVAFSGGVGWAQAGTGTPEAQVAARIASQEFGVPIRWVEDQSRDTRENAGRMTTMLGRDGIQHIVLVTHGWHMPRSLRAFEQASGAAMQIEVAPVGLNVRPPMSPLAWIPSTDGHRQVRDVLRELVGLSFGF